MCSQRIPVVGGDPCVTVTTKKFEKGSTVGALVELRSLRKGEFMVVSALPGQVVELKVILIPAKPARTSQLLLKVTDDIACLRAPRGGVRRNDV